MYQTIVLKIKNDFHPYLQLKNINKMNSVWTIEEVNDLTFNHPYTHFKKIFYCDHWGGINFDGKRVRSGKRVSAKINGTTWRHIYIAADEAIRKSGDDHHIFIESFTIKGDRLFLDTGS